MSFTFDHFAIAVRDTEQALKLWRDQLGFRVLFAEKVNNETVLLTHLDLGGAQLQLVQPLVAGHPLLAWIEKNGEGLHHVCLATPKLEQGIAEAAAAGIGANPPHQGTQGRRAVFLTRTDTQGVQLELCGP
ncbi:VOC family protein [Nibricoccus sp. IMCC34717]|uniref:VOC family protein n=1 Tax=Nibricoccus sp. IMCC34717 TaxID=3034021 RepID=UPI00384F4B1C